MADEETGTENELSDADSEQHEEQQIDPTEQKARDQGWVPQDEWKGDPDKWRPADEFVRVGEQIAPRLAQQNRKLEARVAELSATIDSFREFMPKVEERMYNRALKDIERKRDKAAKEGDLDGYEEAIQEAKDLTTEVEEARKAAPKAQQNGQDAPNPVVDAWIEKNAWFQRDKKLSTFAAATLDEVAGEYPGMSLEEQLEEVTKEVRRRFPEKFGKPNGNGRTAPDLAGGGDSRRGGKKGKSYSDLPPEAKQACDKYVKDKLITREEYIREYFAGDA